MTHRRLTADEGARIAAETDAAVRLARNAYLRDRRKRNRAKVIAWERNYRDKNRERIAKYQKDYQRDYRTDRKAIKAASLAGLGQHHGEQSLG